MDYELKVTNELAQKGAEIIINISASPFHDEQPDIRKKLIEEKVRETRVPFIYCNLVGAQDELIFDGNSVIYNQKGEVIGSGKSFSEDLVIANITPVIWLVGSQNCCAWPLLWSLGRRWLRQR